MNVMEQLSCIMRISDESNDGEGIKVKEGNYQVNNHASVEGSFIAQCLNMVNYYKRGQINMFLKVIQLGTNAVSLPG